jgi:hypothetical protein
MATANGSDGGLLAHSGWKCPHDRSRKKKGSKKRRMGQRMAVSGKRSK